MMVEDIEDFHSDGQLARGPPALAPADLESGPKPHRVFPVESGQDLDLPPLIVRKAVTFSSDTRFADGKIEGKMDARTDAKAEAAAPVDSKTAWARFSSTDLVISHRGNAIPEVHPRPLTVFAMVSARCALIFSLLIIYYYCAAFTALFEAVARTGFLRVLFSVLFHVPIAIWGRIERKLADFIDRSANLGRSTLPAVTVYSLVMRFVFAKFMFLSILTWSEFGSWLALWFAGHVVSFPLRMTRAGIRAEDLVSSLHRHIRPASPPLTDERVRARRTELALLFYHTGWSQVIAGIHLLLMLLAWRFLWNSSCYQFSSADLAADQFWTKYLFSAAQLGTEAVLLLGLHALFRGAFAVDAMAVGGGISRASKTGPVMILVCISGLINAMLFHNNFVFEQAKHGLV